MCSTSSCAGEGINHAKERSVLGREVRQVVLGDEGGGKKWSRAVECGKRIATWCKKSIARRLAAVRAILAASAHGGGCGQAPSLPAAGRKFLDARCAR